MLSEQQKTDLLWISISMVVTASLEQCLHLKSLLHCSPLLQIKERKKKLYGTLSYNGWYLERWEAVPCVHEGDTY